ncbi:H-NS histone family protein [Luteimonas viscosa]|uniref:H-NS histone family protein n=1 Tax=Luteimonas viscosa TaxID=1132694 RepID=A0A5D4XSE4_9GAMM|nr:H-NS histone family protein [Luteimonas viscosa]TYT25650.1 H-NS histone family protein [Luteimonas viscosa]
MAIDLTAFSPKQLDALISEAKRRKTALRKRKPIAAIRKRIVDFATAEGYTVQELFGGRSAASKKAPAAKKTAKKAGKTGRKLGKVPPKYRNPAVPSETWTGRGKQPRWMAALVKKGRKPEDFLIKK